ncbi:hypothetical protein CDAR_422361 [Caerostris darwini]|uniref:Uncharacterized protein n=1 Tax=Caerostris darwini TaxID=1538125 RepID=A0AAV4P5T5_9ARAC|nr:hypothetical protein CDAR_393331 [Caerostris darwini]GIY87798.1 hypothetical protein CDAR_422361 [Caerostris darwini]
MNLSQDRNSSREAGYLQLIGTRSCIHCRAEESGLILRGQPSAEHHPFSPISVREEVTVRLSTVMEDIRFFFRMKKGFEGTKITQSSQDLRPVRN